MEYQLKQDENGLYYQVPVVEEEVEPEFVVPDKVFDIPGLETGPVKKSRKKRGKNVDPSNQHPE